MTPRIIAHLAGLGLVAGILCGPAVAATRPASDCDLQWTPVSARTDTNERCTATADDPRCNPTGK